MHSALLQLHYFMRTVDYYDIIELKSCQDTVLAELKINSTVLFRSYLCKDAKRQTDKITFGQESSSVIATNS